MDVTGCGLLLLGAVVVALFGIHTKRRGRNPKYAQLALISSLVTAGSLAAFGILMILDQIEGISKNFTYGIALLLLPVECGVLPVGAVLTLLFSTLAFTQKPDAVTQELESRP